MMTMDEAISKGCIAKGYVWKDLAENWIIEELSIDYEMDRLEGKKSTLLKEMIETLKKDKKNFEENK